MHRSNKPRAARLVLFTSLLTEQGGQQTSVCVSIYTHPPDTLHTLVYQRKEMAGFLADTARGLKRIPQQKLFTPLNRSVVLYTNVHCAAYLYLIWNRGDEPCVRSAKKVRPKCCMQQPKVLKPPLSLCMHQDGSTNAHLLLHQMHLRIG